MMQTLLHTTLLLLTLASRHSSLSFMAKAQISSSDKSCHASRGADGAQQCLQGLKGSTADSTNDMASKSIITNSKMHIIYGTAWKKDETSRLVSDAVQKGFRFIDTACQPKHYNEAGVGTGWTDAASKLGLKRSDLYLQTKFTSIDGQDPKRIPYDRNGSVEEQVRQSLQVSLSNLRTDYIDALVLHSPFPTMEDTLKAWKTMETFVDEGTVRKLGISNCYDMNKFRDLYSNARIKPSVLQNRFYAQSNFDTELRAFCKEKGILYQSFWTLTANRDALASMELRQMAELKGLTPQTLMYAFMMSLGHTPLDGTTSAVHMEEDISLTQRIQSGEKIFSDEEELRKMAKALGMPDL